MSGLAPKNLARTGRRISLTGLLVIFPAAFKALPSLAQELDPRSYGNLPVGMNFVVAGFTYQTGEMLLDPNLRAEDATTDATSFAFGYLRSFALFGKAAKLSAGGTYSNFSASGVLDGVPRSRQDQGFTDPAVKLSVNLLGSPALTMAEFHQYRQDLIIGASLGIRMPAGQYDSDKLINLGFYNWSIKPEIGISKDFGNWIIEGSAAVAFFTDNNDFNDGKTRSQAPLSSAQLHIVYQFPIPGIWAALDATRYLGGETSVNGVDRDDEFSNNRFGVTLAVPISVQHSIKFFASTGVDARRGVDYDLAGLVWQYRWGGGI